MIGYVVIQFDPMTRKACIRWEGKEFANAIAWLQHFAALEEQYTYLYKIEHGFAAPGGYSIPLFVPISMAEPNGRTTRYEELKK